jgi:hypothetical protein
MARITLFVLQTFVESADGELVAEEPREAANRWAAVEAAQQFATTKAGVVAWAKSGDPDMGEWDDDPEILFRAGLTGE